MSISLRKSFRWLAVPLVLLAVMLLSHGTASAATTVTYSNFTASNLGDFQLNEATASLNPNNNNVLRLTNNYGQAGSAFLKNPISLASDASFSTAFRFEIHGSQSGGADGLVFVVQTVSNTAGGGGGGIGYQGIANSLGIEFDTWNNGNGGNPETACDDDDNHVGINLNGSLCSDPRINVDSLGQMDAGGFWYAWVDYDGFNQWLEVRVSRTDSRPADALLSKSVDLLAVLGQTDAYVGFTSGTGGAMSVHDIVTWEFTGEFAPIDAPPPLVDTDEDGIVDPQDNCANDANADQTDSDGDGIGNVCDPTPNGDGDGDGDGGSKRDILNSCKQGGSNGRDKAPGLDKPFNDKSKAANNVCK